jgi:hypothetical protein
MNPFSLLYTEHEEVFTNNPQRKLAKMKRKYLTNPTPDLKKKIEDMDTRLNPKKTNYKKKKNKKKKKIDDIDLETEYQKHNAYWKEYRKKNAQKENEEKKRREERKRERERDEEDTSFHIDLETRLTLPDDIQEFINSVPTKKMYNKLSLKYHPDKGGDEEMFKILNNHMNH